MGDNDTRLVLTKIDWGTAFSAAVMFLQHDPLPPSLKRDQLVTLERVIEAARKRLLEKSDD